jgi:FAD/FMN-containing dehydrogenase
LAGHGAVEGGVLIDLSRMNRLEIDADRRVARIEPGQTWGAVAGQLQPHSLALTSGDTATVGVGGLALGGGIGWMARKHGLTIDHLLSVELVTADGQVLTASTEENADLFWGLRGGGGNFGVATAFEFKLDPVGMIVGGAVFYDAANAGEILAAYVHYATRATDELTTMAMILPAPPAPFIPPHMQGRPVLMLAVCYSGDLSAGASIVGPLRRLDKPVAEMIEPMPYPALLGLTAEFTRPVPMHEARSTFLDHVDAGLVRTIADQAGTLPGPGAVIQLRVLGGAMARVAADATAFAHRDKAAMLSSFNSWRDPAESIRRRAWTERVWQAWRPYASGAYVSFLGDEGEARIRDAYPAATYARLARLKKRYDPQNIFSLNQNIRPRHSSAVRGTSATRTEGAA